MKKIMYLIISFCLFYLLVINNVSAAETDSLSIEKEASSIKVTTSVNKVESKDYVTYDPNTGEVIDGAIYEEYITLKIMNLSDNFYVLINSEKDGSTKTYSSDSFVDGVLSIDYKDIEELNNLTIKIYTSDKTSNPNTEVLTHKETIPKYNVYSSTAYCERHTDDKNCQTFINFDIDDQKFNKLVEKDETEISNKASNKAKYVSNIESKKKRNRLILIIGASSIAFIGVVTTIVIFIRRRSRLL